jgi:hypothetical protein
MSSVFDIMQIIPYLSCNWDWWADNGTRSCRSCWGTECYRGNCATLRHTRLYLFQEEEEEERVITKKSDGCQISWKRKNNKKAGWGNEPWQRAPRKVSRISCRGERNPGLQAQAYHPGMLRHSEFKWHWWPVVLLPVRSHSFTSISQ